MAEDIDVAQADEPRPGQGSSEGSALDQPMRDEEGQLRHEFVEAIARASGDDILDQMVSSLQTSYGVSINRSVAERSMQ